MRTFVQSGNTIDAVAPSGGVVSGVPKVIGNLFGIPEVTAAEGETFAFTVVGCHRLPKAAGQILAGAKVWWDATTGHNVSNVTGSGFWPIGCAVEGVATDATEVVVRLDGIGLTAAGA